MTELDTRFKSSYTHKYESLPSSPHLSQISQKAEEAKRDVNYCEWINGKAVSRYFSRSRSRVNLLETLSANKGNYLSIAQLDFLARTPQEEILLNHKNSLTQEHFALINRYRSIYYPEILLTEEKQQLKLLAAIQAELAEAKPAKVQELKDNFKVFLNAKSEALKSNLSNKEQDFRIKALATLGALALSATTVAVVNINRDGDSERFVANIDPLDKVEYVMPILEEAASTSPDFQPSHVETASLITANTSEIGEISNAVEIPVAAQETELIQSSQPTTSLLVVETVNINPKVVLPTENTVAFIDVLPVEIEASKPENDEIIIPESMPEEFILTYSEPIVKINTSAVNRQTSVEQISSASVPEKYEVVASPPPTTEVVRVSKPAAVSEQSQYRLNAQQESWLKSAGIPESEWGYVNYIFTKESYWQPFLWNYQGSSAYGLCQRMISVHPLEQGERYMEDPLAQVIWCDSYARERYGSWQNAYNAWRQQNWW